jgi:hypothetical protein
MKVWKAFGSAHSADLTIVGEFQSEEDALLMEQVVEDFVNAAFEERYPDARGFCHAWESRLPGVTMLGPHDPDFELGLQDTCTVTREGSRVSVSNLTFPSFDGIIRLMLLKYPTQITVRGRTGP